MSSAAPTVTEKPKQGLDHSKPYNVVLWNDEVNTFDHVIQVLVQVVGHSPQKAASLARAVHEDGKAIVKTTHLEHAEMFRDMLEANGLTATIEQAG